MSSQFVALSLILTLFLSPYPGVSGARILFLIPMSTTSEKHFFEPLISALASGGGGNGRYGGQGHTVTVVTNTPSPGHSSHPNITEIVPISVDEVFGNVANISDSLSFWEMIFLDMNYYLTPINKIYSSPSFAPILHPPEGEKYDLIFTNTFFGPAFYGVIHRSGKGPFILLHTLSVANYFLKDWGLYAPPSHVPYPLLPYTDRMGFMERVVNWVLDWGVYIQVEWSHIPLLEAAYRAHLGEETPSVKEIEKGGSLIMMNTHFLSNFHRPLMPDAVEIGGLHCKEAKPLPQDLEDFVKKEAAPEGFILLSFGTVLKGSTLPNEIKEKFLRVLGRLRQKVIWKWEEEQMEGLPDNVILRKWLPQQDILGHSNIRLFISHGGLLSTQQTLFHGVPVLMFPFFFDQTTNAKGAEQGGAGLVLDIWNFGEQDLEQAINSLINEPKYRSRAQNLSRIFRDQMNSPLERALYWTEHVLKYEGAPHLRSSARELNPLQFHSIDVIAFLLISTISTIFIIIKAFKTAIIFITGGGKKASKEKKS